MPLRFITLISLLFLTFFFRFYHLYELAPFGWDQARDAQVVSQVLRTGRPTLIGPSAFTHGSFFLGPLWYYLLLPGYALYHLHPLGAALTSSVFGVLTTLIVFALTARLFNPPTAYFTAFIYSTTYDRLPWNPIIIPLLTLPLLFSLFHVLKGHTRFAPLAFFLVGLSLHSHFQATFFLLLLVVVTLYSLFKHHLSVRLFLISLGCFLLPLLPLFLFDLRHDWLNFNGLLHLFTSSTPSSSPSTINLLPALEKFLRFSASLFFSPPYLLLGALLIVLATLGLILSRSHIFLKLLLLALLLLPVVVFSFSPTPLSEYYFLLTALPLIVGLGLLAHRLFLSPYLPLKLTPLVVICFLIVFRLRHLLLLTDPTSLYFQQLAVDYVSNQSLDPIYAVSFSTPANADAGFPYLFSLSTHPPNPSGHLWTLVIPPNSESLPPLITFGGIGIIRR